jgi:hypothetical protein
MELALSSQPSAKSGLLNDLGNGFRFVTRRENWSFHHFGTASNKEERSWRRANSESQQRKRPTIDG